MTDATSAQTHELMLRVATSVASLDAKMDNVLEQLDHGNSRMNDHETRITAIETQHVREEALSEGRSQVVRWMGYVGKAAAAAFGGAITLLYQHLTRGTPPHP